MNKLLTILLLLLVLAGNAYGGPSFNQNFTTYSESKGLQVYGDSETDSYNPHYSIEASVENPAIVTFSYKEILKGGGYWTCNVDFSTKNAGRFVLKGDSATSLISGSKTLTGNDTLCLDATLKAEENPNGNTRYPYYRAAVTLDYTIKVVYPNIPLMVTYNANGGVGTMASQTLKYGVAVSLRKCSFTRIGYAFAGWSTLSYALTPTYLDGAQATFESSETLFAVWEKIRGTGGGTEVCRVTFDGNGGKASVTSLPFYVNSRFGSDLPTATRTGYTFVGWQLSSGEQVLSNTACTGDQTLTAKWTACKYQVTLSHADATGGSDAVTATYGSMFPKVTPPVRPGYTFTGYWTATRNGTQYVTADGMGAREWDFVADKTLYAQWQINTYQATFAACGGTGGTSVTNVVFGNMLPSIKLPTASGYAFLGYYDESGIEYVSSDGKTRAKWDKPENGTLRAWWAPCTTVRFHPNWVAGEPEIGTLAVTAGEYAVTQPYGGFPKPSREGYSFTGWYKGSVGGAEVTTNDIATTELHDLYARWELEKGTREFEVTADGGSLDVEIQDWCIYGCADTVDFSDCCSWAYAAGYARTNGKSGTFPAHQESVVLSRGDTLKSIRVDANPTANARYALVRVATPSSSTQIAIVQKANGDAAKSARTAIALGLTPIAPYWSGKELCINETFFRTVFFSDGTSVTRAPVATGKTVAFTGARAYISVPYGSLTNRCMLLVQQPTTPPAGYYAVDFSADNGTTARTWRNVLPGEVFALPPCTFTASAGKRFAGWSCSNGKRYDDGMLVFNLAPAGETVTMTAIWE